MTFTQRFLQVSFSMSDGSGGSSGMTSFSNLRMSANVTLAGSAMNHLHLSIYGMTLSEMNALSYVPIDPQSVGLNTIQVKAGDAVNGMSTVFEGTIYQAWPNMQNAPEVSFDVEGMVGVYNGVKPAKPPYLSYTGPTDVAQIAKTIAGLHTPSLTLENNGVSLKIDSPYFSGSPRNMMHQLGKHARIGWVEDTGKMAIWLQNGSRTSASGITITPQNGMVGYPMAVPGYIVVKKEFDKNVPYGCQVTVANSDIQRANGTRTCWYVNYELDSMLPNGRWFATLFCWLGGGGSSPAPPP